MFSLFSVLLLTLVLCVAQTAAQTTDPSECATGVHAIFARGQGKGNDMDICQTLADLIVENIPGSTYVGLPYAHASYDLLGAVDDGGDLVQEYIEEYAASCPDSKIFLLGYSLGAIAVMDGICGSSSLLLKADTAINARYTENVIAVAVYGDLTHSPRAAWNMGTCTDGIGVLARLRPSLCEPYAAALRSYCDQGDKFCCNPFAKGDNLAHLEYFTKYNADLLNWLQERLAQTAVSNT